MKTNKQPQQPKAPKDQTEWDKVFQALRDAKPAWREDGFGLQGPPTKRDEVSAQRERFPDATTGKLVTS